MSTTGVIPQPASDDQSLVQKLSTLQSSCQSELEAIEAEYWRVRSVLKGLQKDLDAYSPADVPVFEPKSNKMPGKHKKKKRTKKKSPNHSERSDTCVTSSGTNTSQSDASEPSTAALSTPGLVCGASTESGYGSNTEHESRHKQSRPPAGITTDHNHYDITKKGTPVHHNLSFPTESQGGIIDGATVGAVAGVCTTTEWSAPNVEDPGCIANLNDVSGGGNISPLSGESESLNNSMTDNLNHSASSYMTADDKTPDISFAPLVPGDESDHTTTDHCLSDASVLPADSEPDTPRVEVTATGRASASFDHHADDELSMSDDDGLEQKDTAPTRQDLFTSLPTDGGNNHVGSQGTSSLLLEGSLDGSRYQLTANPMTLEKVIPDNEIIQNILLSVPEPVSASGLKENLKNSKAGGGEKTVSSKDLRSVAVNGAQDGSKSEESCVNSEVPPAEVVLDPLLVQALQQSLALRGAPQNKTFQIYVPDMLQPETRTVTSQGQSGSLTNTLTSLSSPRSTTGSDSGSIKSVKVTEGQVIPSRHVVPPVGDSSNNYDLAAYDSDNTDVLLREDVTGPDNQLVSADMCVSSTVAAPASVNDQLISAVSQLYAQQLLQLEGCPGAWTNSSVPKESACSVQNLQGLFDVSKQRIKHQEQEPDSNGATNISGAKTVKEALSDAESVDTLADKVAAQLNSSLNRTDMNIHDTASLPCASHQDQETSSTSLPVSTVTQQQPTNEQLISAVSRMYAQQILNTERNTYSSRQSNQSSTCSLTDSSTRSSAAQLVTMDTAPVMPAPALRGPEQQGTEISSDSLTRTDSAVGAEFDLIHHTSECNEMHVESPNDHMKSTLINKQQTEKAVTNSSETAEKCTEVIPSKVVDREATKASINDQLIAAVSKLYARQMLQLGGLYDPVKANTDLESSCHCASCGEDTRRNTDARNNTGVCRSEPECDQSPHKSYPVPALSLSDLSEADDGQCGSLPPGDSTDATTYPARGYTLTPRVAQDGLNGLSPRSVIKSIDEYLTGDGKPQEALACYLTSQLSNSVNDHKVKSECSSLGSSINDQEVAAPSDPSVHQVKSLKLDNSRMHREVQLARGLRKQDMETITSLHKTVACLQDQLVQTTGRQTQSNAACIRADRCETAAADHDNYDMHSTLRNLENLNDCIESARAEDARFTQTVTSIREQLDQLYPQSSKACDSSTLSICDSSTSSDSTLTPEDQEDELAMDADHHDDESIVTESEPEGPGKWENLATSYFSADPVVLKLQRSLASAALENELMQSRLRKAASDVEQQMSQMGQEVSDAQSDLQRAVHHNQALVAQSDGDQHQINILRDQLVKKEQALAQAEHDRDKLHQKLQGALGVQRQLEQAQTAIRYNQQQAFQLMAALNSIHRTDTINQRAGLRANQLHGIPALQRPLVAASLTKMASSDGSSEAVPQPKPDSDTSGDETVKDNTQVKTTSTSQVEKENSDSPQQKPAQNVSPSPAVTDVKQQAPSQTVLPGVLTTEVKSDTEPQNLLQIGQLLFTPSNKPVPHNLVHANSGVDYRDKLIEHAFGRLPVTDTVIPTFPYFSPGQTDCELTNARDLSVDKNMSDKGSIHSDIMKQSEMVLSDLVMSGDLRDSSIVCPALINWQDIHQSIAKKLAVETKEKVEGHVTSSPVHTQTGGSQKVDAATSPSMSPAHVVKSPRYTQSPKHTRHELPRNTRSPKHAKHESSNGVTLLQDDKQFQELLSRIRDELAVNKSRNTRNRSGSLDGSESNLDSLPSTIESASDDTESLIEDANPYDPVIEEAAKRKKRLDLMLEAFTGKNAQKLKENITRPVDPESAEDKGKKERKKRVEGILDRYGLNAKPPTVALYKELDKVTQDNHILTQGVSTKAKQTYTPLTSLYSKSPELSEQSVSTDNKRLVQTSPIMARIKARLKQKLTDMHTPEEKPSQRNYKPKSSVSSSSQSNVPYYLKPRRQVYPHKRGYRPCYDPEAEDDARDQDDGPMTLHDLSHDDDRDLDTAGYHGDRGDLNRSGSQPDFRAASPVGYDDSWYSSQFQPLSARRSYGALLESKYNKRKSDTGISRTDTYMSEPRQENYEMVHSRDMSKSLPARPSHRHDHLYSSVQLSRSVSELSEGHDHVDHQQARSPSRVTFRDKGSLDERAAKNSLRKIYHDAELAMIENRTGKYALHDVSGNRKSDMLPTEQVKSKWAAIVGNDFDAFSGGSVKKHRDHVKIMDSERTNEKKDKLSYGRDDTYRGQRSVYQTDENLFHEPFDRNDRKFSPRSEHHQTYTHPSRSSQNVTQHHQPGHQHSLSSQAAFHVEQYDVKNNHVNHHHPDSRLHNQTPPKHKYSSSTNYHKYEDLPTKPTSYDREPTHDMSYDKDPTHQMSYDREPTHQMSYDRKPTHGTSYDKDPTCRMSYDREPNHGMSYDREPNHDMSCDKESTHPTSYDRDYNRELNHNTSYGRENNKLGKERMGVSLRGMSHVHETKEYNESKHRLGYSTPLHPDDHKAMPGKWDYHTENSNVAAKYIYNQGHNDDGKEDVIQSYKEKSESYKQRDSTYFGDRYRRDCAESETYQSKLNSSDGTSQASAYLSKLPDNKSQSPPRTDDRHRCGGKCSPSSELNDFGSGRALTDKERSKEQGEVKSRDYKINKKRAEDKADLGVRPEVRSNDSRGGLGNDRHQGSRQPDHYQRDYRSDPYINHKYKENTEIGKRLNNTSSVTRPDRDNNPFASHSPYRSSQSVSPTTESRSRNTLAEHARSVYSRTSGRQSDIDNQRNTNLGQLWRQQPRKVSQTSEDGEESDATSASSLDLVVTRSGDIWHRRKRSGEMKLVSTPPSHSSKKTNRDHKDNNEEKSQAEHPVDRKYYNDRSLGYEKKSNFAEDELEKRGVMKSSSPKSGYARDTYSRSPNVSKRASVNELDDSLAELTGVKHEYSYSVRESASTYDKKDFFRGQDDVPTRLESSNKSGYNDISHTISAHQASVEKLRQEKERLLDSRTRCESSVHDTSYCKVSNQGRNLGPNNSMLDIPGGKGSFFSGVKIFERLRKAKVSGSSDLRNHGESYGKIDTRPESRSGDLKGHDDSLLGDYKQIPSRIRSDAVLSNSDNRFSRTPAGKPESDLSWQEHRERERPDDTYRRKEDFTDSTPRHSRPDHDSPRGEDLHSRAASDRERRYSPNTSFRESDNNITASSRQPVSHKQEDGSTEVSMTTDSQGQDGQPKTGAYQKKVISSPSLTDKQRQYADMLIDKYATMIRKHPETMDSLHRSDDDDPLFVPLSCVSSHIQHNAASDSSEMMSPAATPSPREVMVNINSTGAESVDARVGVVSGVKHEQQCDSYKESTQPPIDATHTHSDMVEHPDEQPVIDNISDKVEEDEERLEQLCVKAVEAAQEMRHTREMAAKSTSEPCVTQEHEKTGSIQEQKGLPSLDQNGSQGAKQLGSQSDQQLTNSVPSVSEDTADTVFGSSAQDDPKPKDKDCSGVDVDNDQPLSGSLLLLEAQEQDSTVKLDVDGAHPLACSYSPSVAATAATVTVQPVQQTVPTQPPLLFL